MLPCTQLAPARQVIQVGEKISTRRGCPLSRLNRVFRVVIPVSGMTPPFREAMPLPGEVAPGPEAGGADVHDARTNPAAAAATTAAARDLRRPGQATRIPALFLSPATSMTPPSTPRRAQARARPPREARRPTPVRASPTGTVQTDSLLVQM